MTAEENLARHRLSVLELGQALGNVSEACRRRGMTRTHFYDSKRRLEVQGLEGLKDLLPIHKTPPPTTPSEIAEQIVALSLPHPAWGCVRLAAHLKLQGITVSSPTIQSIPIKQGIGSRFEWRLKLEAKVASEPIERSAEQVTAMEEATPCFRERHVESSAPGEWLAQDTFLVGRFKGVGKVERHTVVDTSGSSAFGFWHTGTLPECAVAVLPNDVLPFSQDHRLARSAVFTDNGREFRGTQTHPYERSLALTDSTHKRPKVRHPPTTGCVERFQRTAKEAFFAMARRETFYASVEALQSDFDRWLMHDHTERPHQGYRNLGKRPIETVHADSASVRKEA